MSDDQPILIDSMALAYEAFQGCRQLAAGIEPLLEMLVRTLPLVEQRGALRVEVPRRGLAPSTRSTRRRSAASPRLTGAVP